MTECQIPWENLKPKASMKTQWVLIFEKDWYNELLKWIESGAGKEEITFSSPDKANEKLLKRKTALKNDLEYGVDFLCCSESLESWLEEKIGNFRKLLGCLVLHPVTNNPTVILVQDGRNTKIKVIYDSEESGRRDGPIVAKFAHDKWPVVPILKQVCVALQIPRKGACFYIGDDELTDKNMLWHHITRYDVITIVVKELDILNNQMEISPSAVHQPTKAPERTTRRTVATPSSSEKDSQTRMREMMDKLRNRGDSNTTTRKIRIQNEKRKGFSNSGSVCFMNSVLQVMFEIPLFVERIKQSSRVSLPGATRTLARLISEFECTADGNPIRADELLSDIKRVKDLTIGQQDAHEFFLAIEKGLSTEGTEIDDIFNFEQVIETSAVKRSEMVFCFEVRCSKNLLESINADFHSGPSRQTIRSVGDIFVMHVKRFADNGKNQQKIDIPFKLDYTNLNSDNASIGQYELFGFVVHEGSSSRSGHYTSYVQSWKTGNWYHCNDRSVSVCGQPIEASKDGYLLFYRKSA